MMHVFLVGVTVTVNNSINYVVEETDGLVNITLMFDQPSCRPVTINAHPQIRSMPDATGKISCPIIISMSIRTG